MTQELFKWWFFHVFVVEVKQRLREKDVSQDTKVLLVLDNCRAHPPVNELVYGNIFVAYLPPNVTSLIQPMDQGIIQNFKHLYRSSFMNKLLGTHEQIPDFQKNFTIKDAIFSAAFAWKEVKETTLSRCWHKLWPARMFAEDVQDDDDDDFLGFETGNVNSRRAEQLRDLTRHSSEPGLREVASQELEEWLQADSEEPVVEEMTEEAIVRALRTPTQDLPEDDDSDVEKEDLPKITWEQGHKFLKGFMQFVEQSPAYNAADVMAVHIQMNDFLSRRAKSLTQQDIRKCFERAAGRKPLTPGLSSSTPSPRNTPTPEVILDDDEEGEPRPTTSGYKRAARILYSDSDSE